MPFFVSLFWHRPLGRHSSLVKPLAGSPFGMLERFIPQQMELPGHAWYSR